MVHNLVSIEVVIHRVYNDLNVEYADWTGRAVEWCYNALRSMNLYTTLVPCTQTVTITDYRGVLPCDIRILEAIEYNGYRLAPHHQIGKYYRPNTALGVHPTETYEITINQNISTTFKTGEVLVHYKKLPTEYSHLLQIDVPLIPDNEEVIDALKWYCFKMIISRGYKHSVFNYRYANDEWNRLRLKARHSVSRLDSNERELHKLLWTSFIVNQSAWKNANFNEH